MIRGSKQSDDPMPFCKIKGNGKHQIILVHGFGLNHKSWADISPMLVDNATLYMVDLIGSGQSPAPENWPYTIEAQAEMLMAFIINNKLVDVILVGHSYGGGVALMLFDKMLENQESKRIQHLILIAPAAYLQPLPFFVSLPRVPFFGRLFLKLGSAQFQVSIALKKAFYNKKMVTVERIKRYVGNVVQPSRQRALIQTAKNIIPKGTDQLFDKIEKIELRTLLIYGEKDSVILNKNLERLAGKLPNCVTKKIAGCGHIPHEECPHLTARLVSDFLART